MLWAGARLDCGTHMTGNNKKAMTAHQKAPRRSWRYLDHVNRDKRKQRPNSDSVQKPTDQEHCDMCCATLYGTRDHGQRTKHLQRADTTETIRSPYFKERSQSTASCKESRGRTQD